MGLSHPFPLKTNSPRRWPSYKQEISFKQTIMAHFTRLLEHSIRDERRSERLRQRFLQAKGRGQQSCEARESQPHHTAIATTIDFYGRKASHILRPSGRLGQKSIVFKMVGTAPPAGGATRRQKSAESRAPMAVVMNEESCRATFGNARTSRRM